MKRYTNYLDSYLRFKITLVPLMIQIEFKFHNQADLDNLKGALPGWKLTPYDVTSSYWATPEQLRAMLTDPDWEGKVIKFEKVWMDTSRAETQIG